MSLQALGRLTLVEAKLFLREPAAFFFTLVFPSLLLLVFGSTFGSAQIPIPGFRAVDAMVPSYTVVIVATAGLMGLPVETASARETGVLRRYRATPLHPALYFTAQVLVYLAMTLVSLGLMLAVGKAVFDLRFGGVWYSVLGAVALGALAFLSLGYFIGALAPTARIANAVGMVLYFPMIFLTGATLPLDIMPTVIQRIAEFLPATYLVNLLQGLWFGGAWGEHLKDLGVVLATLAFGALGAPRLFRWD